MTASTIHRVESLALEAVVRDAGTQHRAGLDAAAVDEWTALLADGWPDEMPPISVMRCGDAGHVLVDGFHRVSAASRAGLDRVPAIIAEGSLEDARWAALAANHAHGVRLERGWQRRFAAAALTQRPELADRVIADHCRVSPQLVGRVRAEMVAAGLLEEVGARVGGDGRVIATADIGRPTKRPMDVGQSGDGRASAPAVDARAPSAPARPPDDAPPAALCEEPDGGGHAAAAGPIMDGWDEYDGDDVAPWERPPSVVLDGTVPAPAPSVSAEAARDAEARWRAALPWTVGHDCYAALTLVEQRGQVTEQDLLDAIPKLEMPRVARSIMGSIERHGGGVVRRLEMPDGQWAWQWAPPWLDRPEGPASALAEVAPSPEPAPPTASPAVEHVVAPLRPATQTPDTEVNLWRSPPGFIAAVLDLLGLPPIALDVAALSNSTVAEAWFGPDHPDRKRRDALAQPFGAWSHEDGPTWVNHPYTTYCKTCGGSVKWSDDHAKAGHVRVTAAQWLWRIREEGAGRARRWPLLNLGPVRADSAWWHECVQGNERTPAAKFIILNEGRLAFLDDEGTPNRGANFGNYLAVYATPPPGCRFVPQLGRIRATGPSHDPWGSFEGFVPAEVVAPLVKGGSHAG